MAKSLSQVLRKKYHDGADVGLLYVYSIVDDIESWNTGKPTKKKFSQEMFDEAYEDLTASEKSVFMLYKDIHDTYFAIYERKLAYEQQFNNNYSKLMYTVNEIITAEEIRKTVKKEVLGDVYILTISNFLKNKERKDDLENCQELVKDAIRDFSACKEFIATVNCLYDIYAPQIITGLSDYNLKLSVLNSKFTELLNIATKSQKEKLEKYFAQISVRIFEYDVGHEFRSSLFYKMYLPESVDKMPSRADVNNFVKNYRSNIQFMKKEMLEVENGEEQGIECF